MFKLLTLFYVYKSFMFHHHFTDETKRVNFDCMKDIFV